MENKLTVYVNAELVKALKHKCIDDKKSMSHVITELIQQYLKEKRNG